MMTHLIDTTTGIEYLVEQHINDIKFPFEHALLPAKNALALDRARHTRENMMQNIGRAAHSMTSWTYTIPLNTWVCAVFSNLGSMPANLRMWQMEYLVPVFDTGYAFRCQEPGFYNVKGAVSVQISVPAVPVTKITKAECAIIHYNASTGSYTWFWQDTQFANVRVVPGAPETTDQLYLTGWTHSFADKFYMECGDCLWVVHKFTGIADITFIEVYESRLAIQRTGEPFLEDTCCGS